MDNRNSSRPIRSPPQAQPGEVPAVVLEDVSKSFGEHTVLSGVSLQIQRGSVTVMLGPSGTGKSVLLRCLVGLLKPDTGRVLVFGEDVAQLDEKRRKDRDKLFAVRRRFGMLFQDGALFDDMTVFDNVAFPMRLHTKMSEAAIREKVSERLARVGVAHAEQKFPSELSGGMRKRVAFARAIAIDPDIVLCDEPSSGLDPVMSATLDELILEINASLGMTFIIISHDTAEARMVADTIGMLANGKLVTFGPAKQVFADNHPALDQFFTRATQGPIKVV